MKRIEQLLGEAGGARTGTITKDGKYDLMFIATMLANMVTMEDRETVMSDFEKLNEKMAFLSQEYAEQLASDIQVVLQGYKDQQETDNEAPK
jgi:hypothetical protein